jgi:nucleoside-diphosphate-sugar epimerase
MKILLTGASSFTGYWFAKALAAAKHDVVTTFTRDRASAYGDDVRGERVRRVAECSRQVFGCRFGDPRFSELIRHEDFHLLCHHASEVTNYKSPDFDVQAAVENNTRQAAAIMQTLASKGTAAFLWTGSVFEPGEGAGSDGLPSVSPYGLSKALSGQILARECAAESVHFGKYVIPNPFGAWEEPRFTAYLMRTWSLGDVASVRTPAYVRDNIHVSLLAAAYVAFAESLPRGPGTSRLNPSGYVESQGAFAERVAREMRSRTGWPCELSLAAQTEFEEPRVRTNTQPVNVEALGWKEPAAWDEMADWYRARLGGAT